MSDLTEFRDHARRMTRALHTGDCPSQKPPPIRYYRRHVTVELTPCPGCVTTAQRDLWARLADEIDRYLAADAVPHQEGAHLW